MSFQEKVFIVSEDSDGLVGSLNLDGSNLTESNLTALTSNHLQTLNLNQLSDGLTLQTEMETETPIEDHQEIIQTEEVVTEVETTKQQEVKVTSVPPLRPLTIAPKPTKVPLQLKQLGGQQLLLVQSPGTGQAIKLVSPQGQELNLANFSISRPITLKPSIKTVTSQSNISLIQQKPIVMKKIVTTPGAKSPQKSMQTFAGKPASHFMVVQKSEPQMKILQTQSGSNVAVPANAKTITLQQAQEMGLISGNTKLVPQATSTPKIITKPQAKTIKIVPQVAAGAKTITMNQLKSPTKILPATSVAAGQKITQRLILKSAGANQTILPTGHVIQVAGSQAINTGQVHQISIAGKPMQYIKFVTTSLPESQSTGSPIKSTVAGTSNLVLSEVKMGNYQKSPALIAKQKMQQSTGNLVTKSVKQQMVVLPTNYSPQQQKVAIPMRQSPAKLPTSPQVPTIEPTAEPNGIRPRKPCNCTKSKCLKLYCECFANGEFCYQCNCMNCFNNLDFEDHRTSAIKACLERNPNAFRPKIGKAKDMSGDMSIRKHTKGCNCKRSGCLKNYCECYEAKIACSNNCKCVGCRNIEDSLEKKSMRSVSMGDDDLSSKSSHKDYSHFRPKRISNIKQPINFITNDVIEATSQCLLTICDSAEANMQDDEETIRQIIEEFGRCLTEINSCSIAAPTRGMN